MSFIAARLTAPLRHAARYAPVASVGMPALISARFFVTEGKQEGTVKWFDVSKGYGFIVPNDGGADVFVHHSAIHAEGFRSLDENEEVEFDTVVDDRTGKLRAESVTGPDGSYVRGSSRFDSYGNAH